MMKRILSVLMIAGLVAVGGAAAAQTAPPKAEAKKTAAAAPKEKPMLHATCKDGTKYEGKTKKGACSGHKGVKSWDKA